MEKKFTLPDRITEERLKKGPISIFECYQKIPCNPCFKICPKKAVKMKDGMNDMPYIDYELCNGCGLCMSVCPGLAIFTINMNYSEDAALLKLPYELLPLPEEGEMVKGCDRNGMVLGEYKVVKVREEKRGSKTNIISLEIPKEEIMKVRNIIVEGDKNGR